MKFYLYVYVFLVPIDMQRLEVSQRGAPVDNKGTRDEAYKAGDYL